MVTMITRHAVRVEKSQIREDKDWNKLELNTTIAGIPFMFCSRATRFINRTRYKIWKAECRTQSSWDGGPPEGLRSWSFPGILKLCS